MESLNILKSNFRSFCLQEKTVALQATPAERIEQLEAMKARLLNHRAELQSKIDRLTTEPSATAHGTHEQSG